MNNKRLNKSVTRKEDTKIRKDFYKRLIYIGLCIIPIIIFADNKDGFRLVPLPFFVFGMYQFMTIITLSQLIVDDFFPPKIYNEKTTKSFDKFIYYFANTLFFIGLITIIFEIRNFDNTVNGTKLFWTAGFCGIVFAILITFMLKLFQPSVYYESKRRYTVYFGLFIGFFLLATSLAGFVNHHFAEQSTYCKKYVIKRKGISGSRSKEFFLFLIIDQNNEERFSVGKTLYNNFEEGEQIELCMLKGKFGFDYVTKFNKIKKH
jgi:hypothetical protein